MKKDTIIPIERIVDRIYLIRGNKVMLDRDLADLYKVKAIVLRQQVKRNIDRFPSDFMFQLTEKEVENLLSQNVIATKKSLGGHFPYAFTQEGVAMLSSVLRSPHAVQVNISIMRTFVRLREMLATHEDIVKILSEHDKQIANLYAHVEKLLSPKRGKSKDIGYIWGKEK
ncbi:MAG: ORF6N domain-containing protein [Rickettsiales bacterium]